MGIALGKEVHSYHPIETLKKLMPVQNRSAARNSGIRVARLNAQGEREIMDDAARATEQQRLQSVIDSDCK